MDISFDIFHVSGGHLDSLLGCSYIVCHWDIVDHIAWVTNPITRHGENVSGTISNEIMVIRIFFRSAAAILNISISPRVREWHQPNSVSVHNNVA